MNLSKKKRCKAKIKSINKLSMNNVNNQSGFYLLSDNADAFIARSVMISMAKKTLDIQSYIIHNDASGQYLAYALISAAERGVQVRILVDDINLSGRDSGLKILSQHKNIQIRIFNPLSYRNWFRNVELIIHLQRAGRRMHNKAFIADNLTAVIGGRNIGDEYFDARKDLNFVDLDLLSTGPIVSDITHSFNHYWDSQWSTPIEKINKIKVVAKQFISFKKKLNDRWYKTRNSDYFASLKQSDFMQAMINQDLPFIYAKARLFYDHPEKLLIQQSVIINHIGPQVLPYFERAQKELLIASPYFVPGNTGVSWLHKKRIQGVKISILTNSLATTDVIAVHAAYKKYRKKLLDESINLFELKATVHNLYSKTKKLIKLTPNSRLHAKYIVVDQKYVFIGSANMDPRSKDLNTEIGIMVDNKELAQQTLLLFDRTTTLENSYQILLDKTNNRLFWKTISNNKVIHYFSEPDTGFFKKIAMFILSLFPIENLL